MHVAGFNLVSVSLNFRFVSVRLNCQLVSVSFNFRFFVSGITDIDSKLLLRYPYLSLSYAPWSEGGCLCVCERAPCPLCVSCPVADRARARTSRAPCRGIASSAQLSCKLWRFLRLPGSRHPPTGAQVRLQLNPVLSQVMSPAEWVPW